MKKKEFNVNVTSDLRSVKTLKAKCNEWDEKVCKEKVC